jgi:hypothetical protein
MKKVIISVLSFFILGVTGKSQAVINHPASTTISSSGTGLFNSDEILDITLKGNIRELIKNRTGEAKYFPVILTYKNEAGSDASIPITVKTRGHFRKQSGNCTYPPLLLKFSGKDKNPSSFFPDNSSLKLVMPCRGEEFILHEWLVYKLYNLVTPESFRARLVKVNLEDDNNKKMPSPFYGIILEPENQMANRNKDVIIKKKIKPQETMREPFLKMATFEYLIGNTDWSVQYLQNIKLIASDSNSVPECVPYDFDLAGIVNSPYAQPAEELKMSSVRERRYRGFCIQDIKLLDSTVAFYNQLKSKIYKTYTECSLLDEKYIKNTTKFLDEFYNTINNPKLLKKEFQYPCDPNGTGNVIIKGLRED